MSTHIFEPITDRFGYGNYLDLKIIIDSETKYINATKLCQLGGKKLFNWHKTESAKELIKYFNEPPSDQKGATTDISYEVTQVDLKGIPRKDQELIMGTYYHKDLIVHIAQWISLAFAFKVSKIVNDYISRENNRTIRELKGENKSLLDEVSDLKKQNEELLATTRSILDINKNQDITLKQQGDKLDKMSNTIEKMRQHLDNSTSMPNKRESILIYRNTNDSKEVLRVRCGITSYLKKYKIDALWYKEYNNISNSKKALNYMKDHGILEVEKSRPTKVIMPDKDERVFLYSCLRRLDNSYMSE